MDKENPIFKLFIFSILILVGLLLGSILSVFPAMMDGMSMSEMQANPNSIIDKLSAGALRLSLLINHLFLFIIPSIVFGIYFYGKSFFKGFDLGESPYIIHIILGLLLLYVSYPLVNFAYFINTQLPLADWMRDSEKQVEETLNKILSSNSSFMIIVNILLISVMPAIGEELVFRGVIQKQLSKFFKSPHVAIWIAAAIFSGIHFQFEGFLSRVILGAILGYTYYFTKSLWVPIIIHFMNNLIPVVVFMVFKQDLTNTDNIVNEFSWWQLILPLLGVPTLVYLFNKFNERKDNFWA